MNDQLAKYKRIGGVDFMKDLPCNSAGKVLNRELRASYREEKEK